MRKASEIIGKKWVELDNETKEFLLSDCNYEDNIDKRTGECIVDFINGLSVAGRLVDLNEEESELEIANNAKIYDPGSLYEFQQEQCSELVELVEEMALGKKKLNVEELKYKALLSEIEPDVFSYDYCDEELETWEDIVNYFRQKYENGCRVTK